ncbi:MAG TPA: hypothetical protein VK541_02180 [Pedobacter sp.]|uniref:hypothetical protein n=1 Tax=Pedobacter sp. TaxID=1411316 RepID=UPI002BFFB49A|nr:hypothetical protein [Pedobacter sp.]HMI01258.1 hypothetical protein [Pedobacter sp.]
MDKAKIGVSNTAQEKEEQGISSLLDKIEKGDIPKEIFIARLFEMVVELNQKIDNLGQKIIHLSDISRKISEIHTLHFPKDALEKEKNLTEKFLAEILLGIPRKRR